MADSCEFEVPDGVDDWGSPIEKKAEPVKNEKIDTTPEKKETGLPLTFDEIQKNVMDKLNQEEIERMAEIFRQQLEIHQKQQSQYVLEPYKYTYGDKNDEIDFEKLRNFSTVKGSTTNTINFDDLSDFDFSGVILSKE